jgi:hypothetical protein
MSPRSAAKALVWDADEQPLQPAAGKRWHVVRKPQRVVQNPVVHFVDIPAVKRRLGGERRKEKERKEKKERERKKKKKEEKERERKRRV